MQKQRSMCGGGRRPWWVTAWFAGMLVVTAASPFSARSQVLQDTPLPALAPLSAEQVMQRLTEKNKERAEALQHYTGKRSYRLEYRGIPAMAEATMQVDVTFDAPGSRRFTVVSATGSRLLQSRVFARLLESEQQAGDSTNRAHTELAANNYRFWLAGTEGSNYVLNVEPRVDSKFLYRGKIWVDGHDFAVTRIEAQPARNPSFWTTGASIHHTYRKVEGGFYLPMENKTVTSVRLGGTATLTIDYESYQIVAASPLTAAKKVMSAGEGTVWPDGELNVALANFAGSKK